MTSPDNKDRNMLEAKRVYRQIEERCVTCQAEECVEAGRKFILDALAAAEKRGEKRGIERCIKELDDCCLQWANALRNIKIEGE